MIDKDIVENHIDSGRECDYLDFKIDIYDFSSQTSKEDFIVDVLSFANSHCLDDKYIIIGVGVCKDGHKKFKNIDLSKVQDGANYQSLITNNIEPTIIVDFELIDYSSTQFGVFRISKTNRDRPYCLSKQYGKLPKGFIRIRKGEQNAEVTRRDYDLFYKEKMANSISDLKVVGLIDNGIIEGFAINMYNYEFSVSKLVEKITEDISEVNKIIIDEPSSRVVFGSRIKISDEEAKIIREYANYNNVHLNPNFFELGNLSETPYPLGGYHYIGGEEAKKKIGLIHKIFDNIHRKHEVEKLRTELDKMHFVELAIQNIGKVFDSDIKVSITIPKKGFFDYKNFPVPYENTIEDFLKVHIVDSIFDIKKRKGISSYRELERRSIPTQPTSISLPTGRTSSPSYKSMKDYYYDLIEYKSGYEIIYNDDYVTISYIQKDIKPNEIISFPCRIFLNEDIDKIEYSINTKYNPNILNGTISICK
ncbi:MAG: RNA-binding domain-containing protein [Ignavibacteriales bacterium]